MLNKWEGIVLKTRPYGESNKIVTLLTREAGKITGMARGAKKPASRLAAVTQPFTHGSFLIQKGSGMGTIQQGEPLESMRYIAQNIEATAYVSFIAELIDKLVEEDRPVPQVFELFLQAIHAISEEYDPEAIALFVEWKMLPVAGVHPILHQCANCGATEGEFAFSFRYNGFLCHRCFETDPYLIRLTPQIVKLIRMMYTVPIERVGNLSLKRETKNFLKKIVRTMYEEQTGIRLKSRAFLDQLERTPELQSIRNKEEKPDSET